MDLPDWIAETPHDCPILIAGPTASGKSALALAIARHSNGLIVNADALQVYANWHILTARPSEEDERKNPHRLYGCLLYTSPSPRDMRRSRMPSSA